MENTPEIGENILASELVQAIAGKESLIQILRKSVKNWDLLSSGTYFNKKIKCLKRVLGPSANFMVSGSEFYHDGQPNNSIFLNKFNNNRTGTRNFVVPTAN